jgi:hypothetical protein
MANGVSEEAVRAAIGAADEFELLGGGGQRRVWRVRQGDRTDAVKVLLDVDRARVEREVEALKAVDNLRVMKFREALTVTDSGRSLAPIRTPIDGSELPRLSGRGGAVSGRRVSFEKDSGSGFDSAWNRAKQY